VSVRRPIVSSRSWGGRIGSPDARRGDFERAWNVSDLALSNRRAYGPAVWETRCDLVAESTEWDRTTEVVTAVRAAIERGRLLALPAFADRLEGRASLAAQDPAAAVPLLERARDRFTELDARWEEACTRLSLAETLIAAGDETRARDELAVAVPVFEALGSLREAARAAELLGAEQPSSG
jgi:hypothetical protein